MADQPREVKAPASITEPFQRQGFRAGDNRFAADIVEYSPDDPKVRATQSQIDLVPEPQEEADMMSDLVRAHYQANQVTVDESLTATVTPTPTVIDPRTGERKVIL